MSGGAEGQGEEEFTAPLGVPVIDVDTRNIPGGEGQGGGGGEDGGESSASDAGGDSDAEEELKREENLRVKLAAARKTYGEGHPKVVQRVLKLVSCLIGQYKLNETEALLDEIMPVCKERGGTEYIKAIQSRAFCLFKQYRFKDALELFHEQTTLVGPSSALFENMAHTYNSLGDYDNASKYFEKAMELVEGSNKGKKGGIYLGLGLVKERSGAPREALPFLEKALEMYKEAHNDEGSSLIAKASMSVGQCHETLGEMDEAVRHIRNAVRIFKKTVGGTSPLTANALGTLGRMLVAQGKVEEAEPFMLESLELEVDKDAFHPDTIWKLLNALKELWTDGPRSLGLAELNKKCKRYVPAIQRAKRRITEMKLDVGSDKGTCAVIYKTGGEILMLAGEYREALPCLAESLRILKTITDFNCSTLITSCIQSMQFLEGQLQRQAHRPAEDSDSD